MNWYRYPVSVIAYALIGIFLISFGWHSLAGKAPAQYWYYFPAIAGIYLIAAFVLSKINLVWETDVLLQVALVLAPVIWYVNQREPYKRPVYIFVVNPIYTGKLDIIFQLNKDAQTNARSAADTLYFKFDEAGRIVSLYLSLKKPRCRRIQPFVCSCRKKSRQKKAG
jgi:hypothetical protein